MYERVLVQLAPLVGTAGVHALFARSVKLAKLEYPCLDAFHPPSAVLGPIDIGSPAERLRDCLQKQQPVETLEPAVVVFANLLSLLTAFIGARLTAQVLEGAWPERSERVSIERKR